MVSTNLDEKLLEEIWSCVSTDQQTSSPPGNIKQLKQIVQLMTDYFRTGLSTSIDQFTSLHPQESDKFKRKNKCSQEKERLTKFLQKKDVARELQVDWKIGVVVSNNYTQKSLYPVTEVTVNGRKLEFDIEAVAAMRLALAKAILVTEKYRKNE